MFPRSAEHTAESDAMPPIRRLAVGAEPGDVRLTAVPLVAVEELEPAQAWMSLAEPES